MYSREESLREEVRLVGDTPPVRCRKDEGNGDGEFSAADLSLWSRALMLWAAAGGPALKALGKVPVCGSNGEGGSPVLGSAQHRLSVSLESGIFLVPNCCRWSAPVLNIDWRIQRGQWRSALKIRHQGVDCMRGGGERGLSERN